MFVAQGIAEDHSVLLLDEPLTGLDITSARIIDGIIHDESSRGYSVVLTTHDLEEAKAADHVILTSGRVVASGPPRRSSRRRISRRLTGWELSTTKTMQQRCSLRNIIMKKVATEGCSGRHRFGNSRSDKPEWALTHDEHNHCYYRNLTDRHKCNRRSRRPCQVVTRHETNNRSSST